MDHFNDDATPRKPKYAKFNEKGNAFRCNIRFKK